MFKNNKWKKINNQQGFTVGELAVAVVVMMILISVISTIFINVYISFTESKRYSMAMLYATQIAERADKLLFEELTEENLLDINIPSGYNAQVTIETNAEKGTKTIYILISYLVGQNQKTVELQRIKEKTTFTIPNAPIVKEGMVPVKFVTDDSTQGYWVIASSKSTNWYNYYTNQWANVMLLDGITIKNGTKVTDENKEDLVGEKIETPGSMFVWIPRYAYKITDQTIEIEFLYGNTDNYLDVTETVVGTNEDGTQNLEYSQTIKNIAEKDGYKTHPSFQDGRTSNYANGEWDKEIAGFWVAKYAAGFQDATITYNIYGEEIAPNLTNIVYSDINYSSYNVAYSTNALGQNLSSTNYSTQKLSYPVFKPLTYVYNAISTGDSYTISQEISNATEIYGLNSTQVDSHMMKNSEWGAVAYLTQSKYGRNGEEITHNTKNLNNKDSKNIYAVTGYAEDVPNGVGASSTKNMSGVFDLNGCIWERTSAYILNNNESLSTYGLSYATNTSNTKYLTIYPYNTSSDTSIENWRILKNNNQYGDAITETSYEENSELKSWSGRTVTYPQTRKFIFCKRWRLAKHHTRYIII